MKKQEHATHAIVLAENGEPIGIISFPTWKGQRVERRIVLIPLWQKGEQPKNYETHTVTLVPSGEAIGRVSVRPWAGERKVLDVRLVPFFPTFSQPNGC